MVSARSSTGSRGCDWGQLLLAVVIVGSLVGASVVRGGPFTTAQEWLFDHYQQLWTPERSSSRTIIVAIDDASISHIGQWPWPRDQLAAVIDAAGEAAAIGVDVLLPDADRLSPERLIAERHVQDPELRRVLQGLPHPDEMLAAALHRLPTVLAITADDAASGQPEPEHLRPVRERGYGVHEALVHGKNIAWPLPLLANAARGIGVASAPLAASGEIDALPAAVEVGGAVLPGFGLELLRAALTADAILLNGAPGGLSSVSIGGLTVPTDPSGEIRPRFIATSRLSTISAEQLLAPDADRSLFREKIVLVGVTATGVGETFRTPLSAQASAVEVQAELIESILAGDTLLRPFWMAICERALGIIAGLAAGLLLGRTRYQIHAVILFATLLSLVSGSILAFLHYGLLFDWLFAAACLFATSFSALSLRISAEVRARKRREAELRIARIERAAAERELALRVEADLLRDNLALAVDAAALGMWSADLGQGTWHHSQRHDDILGLASPPVHWKPEMILQRVAPEERAAAAQALAVAKESGNLQLACWIAHPDGSRRAIHMIGRFWKNAQGVPQRAAGVVVDITRQRELEERLRQSETLQSVGLLAGGVAHNFNNLLTVILGNLELARRMADEAGRLGGLIRGAAAAGEKASAIVRQLLIFARKQRLNPRTVDLAQHLKEVVEMLQGSLPPKVQVHLDMPADLGPVSIDPVEFELALLNLGINARDAMPNGGRIDIRAFEQCIHEPRLGLDGRYLVVEVADTGEGIPLDALPKVFEPFFTTKEVGKGTGLGLSQVYGFAHQSGGTVDISSTLGNGTRVTLYLPVADRSSPATNQAVMQ